MPTVKIEKESELYFEVKAKYESSQFADETLAKTYGISGKQLVRIAKRDKWVKGKQAEYYDAKKIVALQETMAKAKKDDNEYKVITKVSKEAQKEGEKLALRTLKSENYKIEMENKLAEVGMKYIEKFADALDNIKNGKVVDTEIEGIVIDDNGKPANLVKKTTVLRPKEFEKIVAMMQAFGILQTTPTVGVQVNNTNAQQNNNTDVKVETQFSKISEQEAFQEFCKKITK
jgi:DNA-directed RNA polymerase subunit H (RpoH/RPB5)